MDLRLTISLDNAAFDGDPGPEAAHILRQLAKKIEEAGLPDHANGGPWSIRDHNGNTIGQTVTLDRDDDDDDC